MHEFEKPNVVASGGIHIGKNFFRSFQATRPFGKIELYQNEVVLKVQYIPKLILRLFRWAGNIPFMIGTYKDFPEEIILKYSEITGYYHTNYGISGVGIRIYHNNLNYPPFLYFRAKNKDASDIIGDFKKMGLQYRDQ